MSDKTIPKEKTEENLKELCKKLHDVYLNCNKEWYTEKFLKVKSIENECKEEFYDYKSCMVLYYKNIKKN
jgi:hypothetical protein